MIVVLTKTEMDILRHAIMVKEELDRVAKDKHPELGRRLQTVLRKQWETSKRLRDLLYEASDMSLVIPSPAETK